MFQFFLEKNCNWWNGQTNGHCNLKTESTQQWVAHLYFSLVAGVWHKATTREVLKVVRGQTQYDALPGQVLPFYHQFAKFPLKCTSFLMKASLSLLHASSLNTFMITCILSKQKNKAKKNHPILDTRISFILCPSSFVLCPLSAPHHKGFF